MVAVKSKLISSALRWELITRRTGRVVGIIAKIVGNSAMSYLPATAPVGGDAFPRQKRAKECILMIVLDVELDADRLQVALHDRFTIEACLV